MFLIKMLAIVLVLLVTVAAGAYPFIKKIKNQQVLQFPIGESLAAGVFLGAGLIHMLGDASTAFYHLHYSYPVAFFICGAVFLLFLYLDHLGRDLYQHNGADSNSFAILAAVMLSIHSLFTGAALGLSDTTSVTVILLLAILAHKWAASFALAVYINKSHLSLKTGLLLFAIFAIMVPLGIVFGVGINTYLQQYTLLGPIFSAIAAGTFLYLGTLHGLEKAVLIKNCCNLHQFYFVILGFLVMAGVAIWT